MDVLSNDISWAEWSLAHLARYSEEGPLLINEAIYAELSARVNSVDDVARAMFDLKISLVRTPEPALFLAGKVYGRYRSAGGVRTGVLPDFFIGAHASGLGIPILTRDTRRYRSYFPDVELITP